MAKQVVDELVALLKLDDKQYRQAVSDAIKRQRELANETESSSQQQQSSVSRLITRYATWGAAIGLVVKGFQKFSNIAEALRDISNESLRMGMRASSLKAWQNAFEMLGKKAEEATGTIEGFQNSINALIYKGELGGNLQMLARLGVRFQDQRGHARDTGEVASDLYKSLQRGLQNKSIGSVNEAAFLAKQAGFDQVGDAIAQGKSWDKLLADARGRSNIEGSVPAARDYVENKTRRAQERFAAEAPTAMQVEKQLDATLEAVNDEFIKMLGWLSSPEAPWNGGSVWKWLRGGSSLIPEGANGDLFGIGEKSGKATHDFLFGKKDGAVNAETGRTEGSLADRLSRMAHNVGARPTPGAVSSSNTRNITVGPITVNEATNARATGAEVANQVARKMNVAQANGAGR